MWILKYGIPILSVLGFGHAVYEVFTEKVDAEKMGLKPEVLRMFGVANAFMTACWVLIFFGLLFGAHWPRSLAIFITGMFLFDYLVSLPLYKNIGDEFFKYWAGVSAIILILYCWRL